MVIGINFIPLSKEQGTGAFRYIQLMFKQMGNYHIQDCKFIVYKQKNISERYLALPKNLNVEYVNVPNIGTGFKRFLFEQSLFYFYLKSHDVFYSYCTSMPLFLKSRKIFTLHDVYFYSEKARYGFLQRNYLKVITKLCISICDKILTVSNFSKNEIIKYYNVEPSKISITYNFIIKDKDNVVDNVEIIDVDGKHIDTNIPYFLFVGNIHPGKNIIRMVKGFERFNDRDKRYNLLICGKLANSGETILNVISDASNVYYLGYQSRSNVEWLFKNCKAVVLISLCEGFGIPPLEGFVYNKPALVSNATSLPEVVGDAGVCVNPLEISDIAMGFQKIEENSDILSSYCSKQIDKFSATDSVEKFMQALNINFKRISD